ncbi:MAG: hypothetical protein A2X13_07220 [Bacteroidetes bacterium GWC2_33_15]|nr:MAG: hypothetical protein A2X10_11485 [Bacteroidetes bacterium GWA2_33_15]OFX51265.1 MAG: hypothetical protein A2X13_07220 [Bacteroidetes bacterium GWC2_33_15]OFX66375.1 MAG: hypothetical protein A2X15_00275 [Bacteroidetes bacterium GWB2_32_14]OFX70668.1 MAG: hypothetical protein A2X14_10960 [Bacteroidetes bacterium GWD2_33_33]HAN20046.1 hypothetical protein [Bacteroidales bacterium]
MKNKSSRALEVLWLITSAICLFTGIHQTLYEGIVKSYPFFIFAVLAFLMFLLRRYLRNQKNSETKKRE